MTFIDIEDLEVTFEGSGRQVRALKGVSLAVEEEESFGIVGESGSGKSTVLRALCGLAPVTGGRISIAGDPVQMPRDQAFYRRVQMVFQDPYASLNPRMRAGEIVAEPLENFGGFSREEREVRAAELFDRVGLPRDAMRRYPFEFSGGQRQRLGIARALAVSPKLIVADEPVSALDVSIQAQVVNLLADLRRDLGLAMLFIAHDLHVVRHLSTRAVVMYLGRIVEEGPSDKVFGAPAHPYTRALMAATPSITARKVDEGHVLAGEMPSPADPPSGCAFRTRCPIASPECAAAVPDLSPFEPGWNVRCIKAGPAHLSTGAHP